MLRFLTILLLTAATVMAPSTSVATAAETLSVTFKTTPPGGNYNPNHIIAVWIETSGGTFVKTIGDYSQTRRTSLTQWRAKAGTSDTDAILGATQSVHTTHTVTWDMTPRGSTTPVADGAYKVWFETVDDNTPTAGTSSVANKANRTSVAFTKNGLASSLAPVSQNGYQNISFTYTGGNVPAVSAGNNQSATAGTIVPVNPAVLVTLNGSPVVGATVIFAVTGGGGTLTGGTATTNASGIATVGSWRLGAVAGTNTVTATTSGRTVTFTATGTAPPVTQVLVNAGNNQSATVGTAVATAPSVIAKDAGNNPVAGATVTFAVATGGGSVTGASATTNASGIATVGSWTLGTTAGANSLTATCNGIAATFNATGTAGAVTQIAVNAGNSQSAPAGAAVATAPSVLVRDVFNNPVSGASVTFAVASGGGSLTGATATSNASGIATVGSWTLGTTAGSNTLNATCNGRSTSFSATGTAGAVTQVIVSAGNNQSATVGTAVTMAPAVVARDSNGNAVSGASVTFAVTAGGGSLTGASTTTNASGLATVGSWTLGGTLGTNTLTATCNGVVASFTATGTAGTVATVAINAGNGQSATAGTAVATAPAVLVQDAGGNPVAGATVVFAVTGGGGSVTGGSATANASGIATVGSWILGTTAGANTLTATSNGHVATFTATGTAGAVTQVLITAGNTQSATVNTAVATAPTVTVKDANGNAVGGASVTFTVLSGGGAVAGSPATANGAGSASSGAWTLGTTAGSNTLRATCNGVSATFTATGTAGAAANLAISSGNTQTALVSTAVTTAPTVRVSDAFGNPVAGVAVTFTVTGGGGVIAGGSPTSNASGLAAVTSWTLGATPVANTLQASASGVVGTVTFTATASATPVNVIAVNAGNGQTGTVGAALAVAPSITVVDQNSLPVAGVAITFTVTGGGGSVLTTTTTTNASGVASAGTWTLGTVPGANTLTAAGSGLSGSPLTFTATATVGPATTLVRTAGNGGSATVGTALATVPAVRVTDAFGNGVSGTTVTFAVTGGGGILTGSPAVTDASGNASLGSWTLGTAAGANSLTASATGLAGSPLTFTATGLAGAAATIARSAGNAQNATVSTAVATAPAVLISDAFGNPVSGVTVTFAVATGGGSLTGASPVSDGTGLARVGSWTLGTVAGANSLTASATGLAGSPLTFTATGQAAAAASIVRVAGNGQTATVGTAVATAPSVQVRDTFGNGVAGIPVTFAVTAGGGGLTGASATTDAGGLATVGSWTLGNAPGTNSLSATATVGSVTFQATAAVGAARTLAVATGTGQSAAVGTALATVPTVRVTDALGNPVAGITVAFAANHGGTLGASSGITDAGGVASPISWTLGTASGTNTLTATVAGLTGSPLAITATGLAGAPAAITVTAGDGQSATVGTAVAVAPAITVVDGFGNGVPGVAVAFTVAAGGGSVTGGTPTTSASGAAVLGSWILGNAPGTNTLAVAAGGVHASIGATALTGPAHALTLVAGGGQSATVGTAVAIPPTVRISDALGNPVAGITVTFSASGGDALGITSTTSDATGQAEPSSWTLGTTAGQHVLTISVPGLVGSPLTVAATSLPGAAAVLEGIAGQEQTALVGQPVLIPPAVRISDAFGNGVAGIAVTFAIAGGDGSLTGSAATTNALGVATAGSWTLGQTAGANALTASAPGLTGSPVTFTATGIIDASAAPVQVSLVTTDAGGPYAPANVTAIWVESPDGTFIKTLGVWATERIADLSRWQAAAPAGDIDAIMGPTRVSHAGVLTVGWDLTAHGGTTPVADANYVIQVEVVDSNIGSSAHRVAIPFTVQNGRGVPKSVVGSGITLAVNEVLQAAPEQSQGSCGVGSLHALLLGLTLVGLGLLTRRPRRR